MGVGNMKVEQRQRRSRKELYDESFNKYQAKALKPIQKRIAEVRVKLAEVNAYQYSSYEEQEIVETELTSLLEMERRILDNPKVYDDRPDQQLYHEILGHMREIIHREVGTQDLGHYNNPSMEVFSRMRKRLSAGLEDFGISNGLEDACWKLVEEIQKVQKEYPRERGSL